MDPASAASESSRPETTESSGLAVAPNGIDDSLDPWHEDISAADNSSSNTQPPQLQTPDPSSLDESLMAGLRVDDNPQPDIEHRPLPEILGEFDPLSHQEEIEAREAWESSETQPPPPRTPSPIPTPPSKDIILESPPQTATSTTSTSGFSSLAAFTRNFTIPSLPRVRPLSLDMAKPLVSPATLSSLGQAQTPPRSILDIDTAIPSGSSTPNDRRAESPRTGGSRDQSKDKAEQPFDFQKFLDQMKLKGAEPIAKYLRSSVDVI